MKSAAAGRNRRQFDRLDWLLTALIVVAAAAVFLALLVTHRWADVAVSVLALAALVVAYAVRREARRELLYRHTNDTKEPE